ncbi:MAG TPA: efflux RND transporter permease subunit, partial [Chitinophagaceae bacterium]|nr:efflux RND transporter permease subunit [Chitinophagaceae bacterium]
SLSVKDGQYRYYIRLGDPVSTIADIANLPIRTPGGTIVPLARLAAVQQEPEIPTGYHLYNGEKGLVITIQKQPDARMTQLVPRVKKAVARFQKDYPQIHFAITRNQTSLLHAGIDNLKQDLLIGGILAIAILFLFLGNYASPTLMSISIPVSLIISCIFFYIFNISFNIISLSGLTLGIGILIDNSIVVLDRITLKRRLGLPMDESCITGTNEIMIPVINAVLTTVAAYVPLIYLSGLAGALIFDQSIALSISLGVSLLVAFILTPLLYKLMVRGKATDMREDTRFYAGVLRGYHQMIRYVFRYKRTFFIITLLVMPIGFFLASHIPISALPQIEKQESLVSLNWNAPIGAKENLRRMKKLDSLLRPYTITREMEIGTRQFLTQHEKENSVQQSEFYYKCKNESLKVKADRILSNWLSSHYSHATWDILDAPNAFTKLFSNETPYFEARFRSLSQKKEGNDSLFNSIPLLVSKVEANNWKRGAGLIREPIMDVTLNERKMMRYNVNRNTIENTLQELFGRFTITQLKHFGDVKSVRFVTNELSPTTESLLRTPVKGTDSSWYPLNNFIRMSVSQDYRFITADKTGSYKSIVFPKDKRISYTSLQERLRKAAVKEGLRVSFTGQYFSDREQLKRLVFIFLLVFSLMYFLMALEFESLIQPLIALFVIPLGVSGAMIILLLSGGSLNVMAAIGFVVILGMIVDNPILMVETINLLRKRYGADQQMVKDPDKLEDIIHEAGEMCLKPLLMVSLTTILALIPILFFTGIGNDLEKPLALVVIGGLSIGTFFTIWFVPLAYWFFTKKNKRS